MPATVTGVAAAAGFPGAPVSPQSEPIKADVAPKRPSFGQRLHVKGTAPPSDAGHVVALQRAAGPTAAYQTLATSRIRPSGRFSLSAPLRRSGVVRVAELPAPGSGGAPASAPRRVEVKAALRLPHPHLELLGSRTASLRGRLLPRLAGREIELQARARSGWRRLSSTRTGSKGGFRLRFAAPAGRALRVLFPGDRANGRTARHVRVSVFTASVASWYNDGGNTACGFHATDGVANRSLPCGTKVTFRHGGRSVVATVDDRGPFVGGREWDLNQNTAAALGFAGVGTVWASS